MEGDQLDLACFEDLVVLDDTLVRKGYDEGLRMGSTKGDEEGGHLGRMKGAEIAVRVAVYKGRLDACRTISAKHPSAIPKRCACSCTRSLSIQRLPLIFTRASHRAPLRRAMIAIEQAAQALEEAEHSLLNPRSQTGFDALELVESKLRAVGSLLKLSQRPSDQPQTLEF
jgi:hypothetical protein